MAPTPTLLRSTPGIKRDGTVFEGEYYVDGEWCRFQRGLPRKMGGYRALSTGLIGFPRSLEAFSANGTTYMHVGSHQYLERISFDPDSNAGAVYDRSPAGLTDDANRIWQLDVGYDTVTNNPMLVAHAGSNLSTLDSTVASQPYYGAVTSTAALTVLSNAPSVSGGIVVIHPYLFVFGSNGYVAWSVAGNFNDFTSTGSGDGYVTAQKIVRGMPFRGGPGNSPAGLLWSIDALIRVTFVGGSTVFQFDTIIDQTSILSAASVIEYDGIFYWCAVDRFMMFNGVAREVPNSLNLNWFFDNINPNQRQKVFAVKVPRYGEIWWCYPRGDATECTHAVILNVRENTWYDTKLPDDGRGAGTYNAVNHYPFFTSTSPDATSGNYIVWQHENGYDKVIGQNVTPIRSFFETADISMNALRQNATSRSLRCSMIEPDFVQTGDMSVKITGRMNARSPEIATEPRVFPDTPNTPEEQVVFFKDIRREMRFIFESNTLGGNYQMGQVIAHLEPADGRVLS